MENYADLGDLLRGAVSKYYVPKHHPNLQLLQKEGLVHQESTRIESETYYALTWKGEALVYDYHRIKRLGEDYASIQKDIGRTIREYLLSNDIKASKFVRENCSALGYSNPGTAAFYLNSVISAHTVNMSQNQSDKPFTPKEIKFIAKLFKLLGISKRAKLSQRLNMVEAGFINLLEK